MIYRVGLRSAPEELEPYDNPEAAKDELTSLRQQFPKERFIVLKGDREINETELEDDIALQGDFIKSSKLPVNYRQGRSHDDDLGIGPNVTANEPTRVWKPPNPEDEYK